MLDQTEQRIIGVLIEKELAVPDSYPLTQKALLTGCNQKSNRDPEMSLEEFELSGAMMALQQKEWVTRAERDGGRAVRYRHRVDDRLGIESAEKAVLAELLLRGPQAPGALKSRVARMGLNATPDEILALLEGMRISPTPLVEKLPRAPRERAARWAHRLGEGAQEQPVRRENDPDTEEPADTPPTAAAPVPAPVDPEPGNPSPGEPEDEPQVRALADPSVIEGLEVRIADLERQFASLRQEVRRLTAGRSSYEEPE